MSDVVLPREALETDGHVVEVTIGGGWNAELMTLDELAQDGQRSVVVMVRPAPVTGRGSSPSSRAHRTATGRANRGRRHGPWQLPTGNHSPVGVAAAR